MLNAAAQKMFRLEGAAWRAETRKGAREKPPCFAPWINQCRDRSFLAGVAEWGSSRALTDAAL